MAANKKPRLALLRAMREAVKSNLIVPDDLFWRPCVPGQVAVPLPRGYVGGECIDEAQIREQAKAGRELMKEQQA